MGWLSLYARVKEWMPVQVWWCDRAQSKSRRLGTLNVGSSSNSVVIKRIRPGGSTTLLTIFRVAVQFMRQSIEFTTTRRLLQRGPSSRSTWQCFSPGAVPRIRELWTIFSCIQPVGAYPQCCWVLFRILGCVAVQCVMHPLMAFKHNPSPVQGFHLACNMYVLWSFSEVGRPRMKPFCECIPMINTRGHASTENATQKS